MRRGGWWTVALGRRVGILRALVPAVAGASGMPYRRSLTANAVGGALRAVVVVLLGLADVDGRGPRCRRPLRLSRRESERTLRRRGR